MQIFRQIFNKIAHYLIFCRKILIIDIFLDENKRTPTNYFKRMRYNSYKYRPKNKSPTDEHEKNGTVIFDLRGRRV